MTRWNGESRRGADLSFSMKLPLLLPQDRTIRMLPTPLHPDRLNA
jgi:hypothetical protein